MAGILFHSPRDSRIDRMTLLMNGSDVAAVLLLSQLPFYLLLISLTLSLSNLADLIIPCLFSLLHSSHLLLDLSFSLLGENVVVAVGERREMASRISSHGQCVLPEHRSV